MRDKIEKILSGLAFALLCLPNVVLVSRVANPQEIFRDYYFCFSMTPYWHMNHYPLWAFGLGLVLFVSVFFRKWHPVLALLRAACAGGAAAAAIRMATLQKAYPYGYWVGTIAGCLFVFLFLCFLLDLRPEKSLDNKPD